MQPDHHRQSHRPPDVEHACRDRGGAVDFSRFFRRIIVDTAVPREPYRQSGGRGARDGRVYASVPAPDSLFRASRHGRRRSPVARGGNDSRISVGGRGDAASRLPVPRDLSRADGRLQRVAHVSDARYSGRGRGDEPVCRAAFPAAIESTIPARRPQPGVSDRVHCGDGNGQVVANGAPAQAALRGISRDLPAIQFRDPPARQHVQHRSKRARAADEHDHPLPWRVARDAERRFHDWDAGCISDVRKPCFAADAALGGSLAAIPAGDNCGPASRRHHERAGGSLCNRAIPRRRRGRKHRIPIGCLPLHR